MTWPDDVTRAVTAEARRAPVAIVGAHPITGVGIVAQVAEHGFVVTWIAAAVESLAAPADAVVQQADLVDPGLHPRVTDLGAYQWGNDGLSSQVRCGGDALGGHCKLREL